MRWIILCAVILLFAMSVTIKYQPTRAYYTGYDRYNHILKERPAYPLVVYCNTRLPEGSVVYQSWFDEYRVWFNVPVAGRRIWKDSMEYFMSHYDYTAESAYEFFKERGITHVMINPHSKIQLPIQDGEFGDYFKVQTQYGPYTLYRLDTGASGRSGHEVLDYPGDIGTSPRIPDSWLQE